jgi:hypothetical protein
MAEGVRSVTLNQLMWHPARDAQFGEDFDDRTIQSADAILAISSIALEAQLHCPSLERDHKGP